ncbi:MAG: hypothetical protein ACE5E0_01090 [Terriglobia bacterium]
MTTAPIPTEQLQQIFKKIKSRGYWRINLRPMGGADKTRVASVAKCETLVRECCLELARSIYPYLPGCDEATQVWSGHNYVELFVDSEDCKELWRMYMNGQFIHFRGLSEDWLDDNENGEASNPAKPGTALDTRETVHTLTCVYEFLARLAERGIYKNGIDVQIVLYNIRSVKRLLQISGGSPSTASAEHGTTNKEMYFSKQYSEQEVLGQPKQLATDMVLEVFSQFNWENPPLVMIEDDQNQLQPGAS